MIKYKSWGFITFFLPFLFLFQNCEQSLAPQHLEEANQDLLGLGIYQLKIPSYDHLTETRSPSSVSKTDRASSSSDILIDIYKGVVKGPKGVEFCPGYDFFYSLQYILNHASLCVEKPLPAVEPSSRSMIASANANQKSDADVAVCNSEYVPPLAVLISQDGKQIQLGTRDENCNRTHLCSPSKDDFELLIQKFLEIKDTLKCI